MQVVKLSCPRCSKPLHLEVVEAGNNECPSCRVSFHAVKFSPTSHAVDVHSLALGLGSDGTQACAEHSSNRAVSVCDRCGAFMCALCQVDADERILCPGCFDRLAEEGALPSLANRFRNFPGLAVSVSLLGIFAWFAAVVLGPLAFYYGIRGLRQKREMGESDRVLRIYLAMAVGILETIGGCLLLYFMFRRVE